MLNPVLIVRVSACDSKLFLSVGLTRCLLNPSDNLQLKGGSAGVGFKFCDESWFDDWLSASTELLVLIEATVNTTPQHSATLRNTSQHSATLGSLEQPQNSWRTTDVSHAAVHWMKGSAVEKDAGDPLSWRSRNAGERPPMTARWRCGCQSECEGVTEEERELLKMMKMVKMVKMMIIKI